VIVLETTDAATTTTKPSAPSNTPVAEADPSSTSSHADPTTRDVFTTENLREETTAALDRTAEPTTTVEVSTPDHGPADPDPEP